MNFDVALEKYKNGTATEEEKAYVEGEIAKARKLNEVIDQLDGKRVVEQAKEQDVKRAMHSLKKKTSFRIALISLIVVLAVVAITASSLLIYVNAKAANMADFSKKACVEAARQAVIDKIGSTQDIYVVSTERNLYLEHGTLKSAVYVYEVEIRCGHIEYEVVVHATTGKATIVDIDN